MAKMIHSMIRVTDETRSLAFYKDAFGLEIAQRFDFETFNLIYLSNAESSFELELTVNKDQRTAYDPGTGYGHLAMSVDDVDAEHARFTALGLCPRKLVDFAPAGEVIARFFFVTDPDGYEIEVLQRAGRYL